PVSRPEPNRNFQVKKLTKMELSTGKILEENLVQSAFHQTLGDEFTFQQYNNLNHVNVPKWPSYSFDLNLLGNLWQNLKMVG
uniref:Uncharacterized protein n=1 Tax=Oncorhynchus mykiss TaxID=8022 RepID=A0A8K9XAW0_ONCMY